MNASVKLLESTLPTCAQLHVTVPADHPSTQILGTERMGSGTVIDHAGLVLTVNYVVVGAESIEVNLTDGTVVDGAVVAQDFYTGLAIVEIPGGGYEAASTRAQPELAVGNEVFLLASTSNGERRVNNGAVTSLAPFDAYWEFHLECGVLTTAMNPGLGGGGLFTTQGHLAGVVALDLGEIGKFTLSVPVENFVDHRDELLRHGHRTTRPARAWLGLFCYEMRRHIVVGGVLTGAPCERAGLRPGDVILAVDGEPVRERSTLYNRIWMRRPGDLVNFEVFRDSAVCSVAVEAGNAEAFFA